MKNWKLPHNGPSWPFGLWTGPEALNNRLDSNYPGFIKCVGFSLRYTRVLQVGIPT